MLKLLSIRNCTISVFIITLCLGFLHNIYILIASIGCVLGLSIWQLWYLKGLIFYRGKGKDFISSNISENIEEITSLRHMLIIASWITIILSSIALGWTTTALKYKMGVGLIILL